MTSTIVGYFVEEREDGTVVVEAPNARRGKGVSKHYLDKEHITMQKLYEGEKEWHPLWGFDYSQDTHS